MSKQEFYEMIVAYYMRNHQYDATKFQGVDIEELIKHTKELHKEGRIIYVPRQNAKEKDYNYTTLLERIKLK